MTTASLLNGLRLIVALALMLSALPLLRGAPSMHDVGMAQTLGAGLTAVDPSDFFVHGHSHDDGDTDPDHRPGHGSEHQDHSHVTMGLVTASASLRAPDGKALRQWEQGRPSSHPSFRLDRPPCPSFVA